MAGLRSRIGQLLVRSGSLLGGGTGRDVVAMDAGRITRVDPDFIPPAIGVNLKNARYLSLARRRISAMLDDNGMLNGSRDLWRRNTIGANGIFPQPDTGDSELDRKLTDFFWEHASGVDVSREKNLAMSQGEWFNMLWSTGESMVNIPVVPTFRGYRQSPAIEIIDSAARMDLTLDGEVSGSRVRQGVEFDSLGRRRAYHLSAVDPNDDQFQFAPAALGAKGMLRLSAEQATLGFVSRWTGQLRGVPWPVAIVGTMRMEDAFVEAELLLHRVKAAIGVAIKGASGPAQKPSPQGSPDYSGCMRDSYGNPVHELQPGMVGYLPPNGSIEHIQSTTPGATLNATVELLQRRMAVGLGMGYGSFSRDRSKSSFSSDRSDSLEDRKGYRETQMLVWHMHTRPYYEALLTWGVLSGSLELTPAERALFDLKPRRFFEVTVIGPGWEYVNPKQEAEADEIALRSGTKTLQDVCAGLGKHWQDVKRQQLKEEKFELDERARLGLPPKASAAPEDPATPSDAGGDGDQQDDKRPASPGDESGRQP